MARKVPLERIGEWLKVILAELDSAGGEAKIGDLLDRAKPKLNLTAYEEGMYEKSGHTRWITIVRFYSIGCVKAGYIEKKGGGIWRLTERGKDALKKTPAEFAKSIVEEYSAWKRTRQEDEEVPEDTEEVVTQTSYEEAKEQARQEIENRINSLGPYDFQRVVKELLMAMGYHIPFIAAPGPDGGVDIVAYKDPLGTGTPRIRIQVKHRQQKVNAKEVRELEGLLRKEGDIGLMVSSGGFTSDAEREVRSSSKHIETMDFDRLVSLWEQYYDNIRESGKKLLPLVKVYFLAPTEE